MRFLLVTDGIARSTLEHVEHAMRDMAEVSCVSTDELDQTLERMAAHAEADSERQLVGPSSEKALQANRQVAALISGEPAGVPVAPSHGTEYPEQEDRIHRVLITDGGELGKQLARNLIELYKAREFALTVDSHVPDGGWFFETPNSKRPGKRGKGERKRNRKDRWK